MLKLSDSELIRVIALAVAAFIFRNTAGGFQWHAHHVMETAKWYARFIENGTVVDDGRDVDNGKVAKHGE